MISSVQFTTVEFFNCLRFVLTDSEGKCSRWESVEIWRIIILRSTVHVMQANGEPTLVLVG